MADRTIRTALALGAGSDIGIATVEALAAAGLRRCVLAARAPSVARDRIGHLDLEIVEVPWDALDVSTHAATFADIWSNHGPIDVVLCAVGMLGHLAGVTMSPDEVDLMARTNYAGPAAALAAIVPHLVEAATGTIVVYSSVAAVRPRRSNFVYGSSKAGLDAFAHGLADALAGTGVAVVVVRPGFVRSKMTTGLAPAPFHRAPDDVAAATVAAIRSGRSRTVWVPPILGGMFGVLRSLPAPLWRRIAGDR